VRQPAARKILREEFRERLVEERSGSLAGCQHPLQLTPQIRVVCALDGQEDLTLAWIHPGSLPEESFQPLYP